MTARLAAVAAAHARIMARRRTAVTLLALLPLAFYGALYRHSPNAVAVGGVASAFSAGGAAIFSMLPARAADQRLSLAGYRPGLLIAGRLVVLEAVSLAISLITAAVMVAGTGPAHPGEVFAGVILTGLAAVPLGLALGALLPRELEAVLVLIGIVGVQVTAKPDTVISALLPFHDARQLLDAAVSTPAAVWPRLAVTAAYAAALALVSWIAWRARAAAAPQRSSPGARAGRRPARLSRGQPDGHRAQLWLADGLLDAAGEQPVPHPVGVQAGQPGHAVSEASRVGGETAGKVEHVLDRVVGGVADVGLGVDGQPRLAGGGQHVLAVQVGAQQHCAPGVRGSCRNSSMPARASPGSSWSSPRAWAAA